LEAGRYADGQTSVATDWDVRLNRLEGEAFGAVAEL